MVLFPPQRLAQDKNSVTLLKGRKKLRQTLTGSRVISISPAASCGQLKRREMYLGQTMMLLIVQ